LSLKRQEHQASICLDEVDKLSVSSQGDQINLLLLEIIGSEQQFFFL
jgi:ATP-dependent Lon protease